MQFGYHTRLERDVKRWAEKGLIGTDQAVELVAESRSQKSGYSFSSIVIILGVICLCFAAMTFVAANWDEMPKIMRVALLLSAMGIAYIASVMANQRTMPFVADAFVLLGCGVFGATIMLVGQMYHLQGRAQDAVLLWAAGSLLAAFVLRASTALWLAVGLFTLWMSFDYLDSNSFAKAEINTLYLAFWLACAALAWWLRSRMSAHLLMISIVGWIFLSAAILSQRHDTIAYFAAIYAGWFVVISLAITSVELGQWLRDAEAAVIRYSILCITGMSAIWIFMVSSKYIKFSAGSQFSDVQLWPMVGMLVVALGILFLAMKRKSAQIYDLSFCAIWIAIATIAISSIGSYIPFIGEAFGLALSIWFIRMGARQDIPVVNRLGYVAFGMIMLLIYFRTAGTLLGTTGFYLTAGILMVVGAIFLPKLFRTSALKEEAV